MKPKFFNLVLLLIQIGSIKCRSLDYPYKFETENPIDEDETGPDLDKPKKSVTESNGEAVNFYEVSEHLNSEKLLTFLGTLRNYFPEEYGRMKDLLKPVHLNRKMYLKDFVSILAETYYRSLSSESKSDLDIKNAEVDKNLKKDYRTFVKLLEEEVMDYIVPVNFVEIISGNALLGRLAGDDNLESWKIEEVREIDASELFNLVMKLPETLSIEFGYPMERFTSLIQYLIIYPENKYKDNERVRKTYTKIFEKLVKKVDKDIKMGTYPRKSWAVLMKTIFSEIPEDLRQKVFDPEWKSENYVKALDLLKNLNYNVNFFSFKKLEKGQEKYFNEFSKCPRCQRIVLESIMMALEKYLREILPRRNKHAEI